MVMTHDAEVLTSGSFTSVSNHHVLPNTRKPWSKPMLYMCIECTICSMMMMMMMMMMMVLMMRMMMMVMMIMIVMARIMMIMKINIMHICTYIYILTYIHFDIYTYWHIYILTYIHIDIYTCFSVHVHMADKYIVKSKCLLQISHDLTRTRTAILEWRKRRRRKLIWGRTGLGMTKTQPSKNGKWCH